MTTTTTTPTERRDANGAIRRTPKWCKGGCQRRTERLGRICLKCEKGMAPQAIHALTGGRWVRRGLTWRWE